MLRALSRSGFYTAAAARLPSTGRPSHTLNMAIDDFTMAEERYKSLIDQRRSGGIQPRVFRLAVRDLAVLDSEGRRWMLGPEDGLWYRRENDRWLQADPPRLLVCSSCGKRNLGRHSFCVECGMRLDRND
jgi:ribosomal protein L32